MCEPSNLLDWLEVVSVPPARLTECVLHREQAVIGEWEGGRRERPIGWAGEPPPGGRNPAHCVTEPVLTGELRAGPVACQDNMSTCTCSRVVNHPDGGFRKRKSVRESDAGLDFATSRPITCDHPGKSHDRFRQEAHGPSGSHMYLSRLVNIQVKKVPDSAKSPSYEDAPS